MATENQKKAAIFVGSVGSGILIGWLLHGHKAQAAGPPPDVVVSNIRSDQSPIPYQQPVNILWDVTNHGSAVFDGNILYQIDQFQGDGWVILQPGETQTMSVSFTRTNTLTYTIQVSVIVNGIQAALATIPVG